MCYVVLWCVMKARLLVLLVLTGSIGSGCFYWLCELLLVLSLLLGQYWQNGLFLMSDSSANHQRFISSMEESLCCELIVEVGDQPRQCANARGYGWTNKWTDVTRDQPILLGVSDCRESLLEMGSKTYSELSSTPSNCKATSSTAK